jgi:hypothetical protein
LDSRGSSGMETSPESRLAPCDTQSTDSQPHGGYSQTATHCESSSNIVSHPPVSLPQRPDLNTEHNSGSETIERQAPTHSLLEMQEQLSSPVEQAHSYSPGTGCPSMTLSCQVPPSPVQSSSEVLATHAGYRAITSASSQSPRESIHRPVIGCRTKPSVQTQVPSSWH